MRFADPPATRSALASELEHVCSFDFDGVTVEVRSTSAAATRHVERMFAYFACSGRNDAELHMAVVEDGTPVHDRLSAELDVPRPVPGHLVVVSWFDWAFVVETPALLDYYASKLLRLGLVQAVMGDIATLHAASLAGRGSGLLLVGEAAVGKTSLTLRLLQHDFEYCADDTSPLRKDDLCCMRFPTPFLVRVDERSGAAPYPELSGRPPDLAVVNEPRWLIHRWDDVARREVRPTHVLFLDADDRGSPLLTEISPGQAVLELLRNTVLPLGGDLWGSDALDDHLDAFARLASTSRCSRLATRDLDRALDSILAMTTC
jgi:hypothetical protein